MPINMFDTAIDSDNLGDHFIMDAVWEAVRPLFPEEEFIRTPTHRRATLAELREGRKAPLSFVGGTNILKSHMLVRGNWRITPLDYFNWRDVVLVGVGWQQYGRSGPDAATRLFFRRVLSKKWLHSVRDMHTFEHLRPHVPNVLYTACPTMWMLDDAHCRSIPVRKAQDVVFAVTYYRPAPEEDRKVFEMLKRHYRTVYVWPQQEEDLPYLDEIGVSGYVPIAPDVATYDRLLASEDVDFVGARLHGGIRALQHRRRALIIPVDNRATEISVSTALPVASRSEPEVIERWITQPGPMNLTLPVEAIERWKGQFRHLAAAPFAAAASF
ncbi:polysaccharide pyruvyl transferase family protein [Radicibacter daui]|uniref:polysaccharide pyruvyl transferase family protein n=1 Tax=Radicibacter daui TaxID=3064829 RepID=UPI0040469F18